MRKTTSITLNLLAGTTLLILSVLPSQAQWLTQTNILRAGWNAVYLHVDPSHTTINELIGLNDPIEEVWLWNSEVPPGQSLATPQFPMGTQWSGWNQNDGPASVLQTLRGNSALLVRVDDTTPFYEWRVKGKPVAPATRWTLTGLNFIGFPAAIPSPSFESFLAPDAQPLEWAAQAQIFRYQGGILGATNPVQVESFLFRNTPVRRDQAYWVRAGELTNQFYNRYFSPFQISGSGSQGMRFGDTLGQSRLFLKNMTKNILTITVQLLDSEAPPPGQAAISEKLTMLVRGPLNTTNLTFGYSDLSTGNYQWTLAPHGEIGSEAQVILGVDRSMVVGGAGETFAGVLRFSDSLGLSQVDIAASATVPSRTGLWVGKASVEHVSQYLKTFVTATNANHFHAVLNRLSLTTGTNTMGTNTLRFAVSSDGTRYEWNTNSNRVLVFGGTNDYTGSYLQDGPIKVESGGVARPFPLRLIVHNNGVTARLMQRAYIGIGTDSNVVVATRQEKLMPSQLSSARRISSLHLPTSDGNNPWAFGGTMEEGSTITANDIKLSHDDHSSNPFLHTYHPDHDNKDALFNDAELPSGFESYEVWRLISLHFTGPSDDFDSLTQSSETMTGNYTETVTFRDRDGPLNHFDVSGPFVLNRIIEIATLE